MSRDTFFVIASTPRAHAHARTRVESVSLNRFYYRFGCHSDTPLPTPGVDPCYTRAIVEAPRKLPSPFACEGRLCVLE